MIALILIRISKKFETLNLSLNKILFSDSCMNLAKIKQSHFLRNWMSLITIH